uniref:Uncharacterized protein n=1 Tax=Chelydra serpentina TaxID=8475 RepID=A0A8C3SP18_CHESE
MPGRAARQEAAAGSAGAAASAQQERSLAGAFPLVLKKLMENPPRDARLGEGGSARVEGRGAAPSTCLVGWCLEPALLAAASGLFANAKYRNIKHSNLPPQQRSLSPRAELCSLRQAGACACPGALQLRPKST